MWSSRECGFGSRRVPPPPLELDAAATPPHRVAWLIPAPRTPPLLPCSAAAQQVWETTPGFGEEPLLECLWSAIDEVVALKECDVYRWVGSVCVGGGGGVGGTGGGAGRGCSSTGAAAAGGARTQFLPQRWEAESALLPPSVSSARPSLQLHAPSASWPHRRPPRPCPSASLPPPPHTHCTAATRATWRATPLARRARSGASTTSSTTRSSSASSTSPAAASPKPRWS